MKVKTLIFLTLSILLLPVNVFALEDSLDRTNQKVCNRFEMDVLKLSAIMDELRERKGIKETRVAFGGSDTPIKQADYYINFAAEAIAYQRVQKYSSKNVLRSSLEVLKGKILTAKNAVSKALNE